MGCCHSFCKTCCPCCEITCFCCKKFVKRTPSPPISNNGRTSSAAKGNTIGPMPVKPTQQTPEVLQTPDILNMKALPKEKQNVDCLDQIAREATFSDIVKADISLEIDTRKTASQGTSRQAKHNQKEPQNGGWRDKYFVHGISSDIVADVENQTHGCMNASVSEDIDTNLEILHDINIKAASILQDRISKISSREQLYIDQFIQERDDLINRSVKEGRSYADQYEEHYRILIQQFITTLEIEMSKHLDELQNVIAADKESIFKGSNRNIQVVTDKAENARNEFHRRLQQATANKRKEIMDMIDISSKNKTNQPLSYEQLRKLNVELYSTVGLKNNGQGCDNIPERGKFIKDIDKVKPPQPRTKTTVYIENTSRQQANRN